MLPTRLQTARLTRYANGKGKRQMIRIILSAALALMAQATFTQSSAQSVPPEALKDLAPTGKLRAAINFGNGVLAQKGADGMPQGISADLSRELAKRLDVPLEFATFEAAGKAFEAAKENKVDVLFVAIEPVRAADVEFSPPYVLIEGTYMVLKDSPLKEIGDVDRAGVRIAIGRGSAYDLYLTRTLKNATLVRAATGGCCAMIEQFRAEKLEAVAGVRQPLVEYAKTHSDVRVMDGRFQEIRQAMGTPKGRLAAAAYLRTFIEEMKANGFVADALKRSNQPDAQVAPAGG
jgi:polar amino acid transport system substrate-binding protein